MTTKVFIGNLNYKTTSDELGKKMSEVGEVTDARVIARGTYSLGYGFVEYKTPEEAAKAVQVLNNTEVEGHPVLVELARTNPTPPGQGRARRFRRARFPPRGYGPNPGFGGYRQPNPFFAAPYGGGYGYGGYGYRTPRRFGGYGARRFGGYGGRRFGGRRMRNPNPANETTPLSQTRLFVANIGYQMTNEDLAKVFEGMGCASAHVVQRRNGLSRGFGFVEMENHESQQAALQQMNGKQIGDRAIVVTIAREQPPPPPPSEQPAVDQQTPLEQQVPVEQQQQQEAPVEVQKQL